MQIDNKTTDRFLSKVERIPIEGSCWVWIGSQSTGGYGYFHASGKNKRLPKRTHRTAYELFVGAIPPGLWVLHKCDNPCCVNPAHLFIGDRKDNMDDCARKGRVCTIGQSRKTHCLRGHELNENNTYTRANGHRVCKQCRKIHKIKSRSMK